jgi:hypothetical protein
VTESDILYQNGDFWVCASEKGGYEVYCDGITHSTRCAIIGYKGDKGLERAILECDKRAFMKLEFKLI